MFNSHIHASIAQLQVRGSKPAYPSPPPRIQNRNETGPRRLAVDANPKTARSFLSTAWERLAKLISRRNIRAGASIAPLSLNQCKEIRDGYVGAMLRAQFWEALDNSPTEDVAKLNSRQMNYEKVHAKLRGHILAGLEVDKKSRHFPTTVNFILAELRAHELLLLEDKYPPAFLSQIETMAEKLRGILIQSFGISTSDIAVHWKNRDRKLMGLALNCFSEIRKDIPRGMRSRISPAAKMIYCDVFHDVHVKLGAAIPKNRFSDRYVAVFSHEQAMQAIAHKLPDPSSGATNPDGLPQRAIWMANMRTAVLEFLGFTGKKDEQAYEARISGADDILTQADVAVIASIANNSAIEN